jgi:hypothetical protein
VRYRAFLERLSLSAATINLHLSAIRRLADESAESGWLSPERQSNTCKVRRYFHFDASIADDEHAVFANCAHEQAAFKDYVVPRGNLGQTIAVRDVIARPNQNCEIELISSRQQPIKDPMIQAENTFVPNDCIPTAVRFQITRDESCDFDARLLGTDKQFRFRHP